VDHVALLGAVVVHVLKVHGILDRVPCRPERHVRVLKKAYQQQFRDDVERRLQQAGVRLADLIRKGPAD
jgi:hypothetical protein